VNGSVLDLRREVAKRPLPPLPIGDLDSSDLAAARTNWTARMASEHASARVFGMLVGQMMRANLPAAETRRVAAMAEQELDHGVLCARVLAALGGEPLTELPRLDPVPDHADASSPLEAVLRNVISVGCCSETVAVALVGSERVAAGPPAVRRVLDQILADEIKHARFGWRLLGQLAPDLPGAVRQGLDAYLVDVFDHQLRFHAPFLEMGCASEAGIAVGAPHGRSNWLVFVRTMTEIVVPGLSRLGLSAREAWEAVAGTR
jgi:hypothetical protein